MTKVVRVLVILVVCVVGFWVWQKNDDPPKSAQAPTQPQAPKVYAPVIYDIKVFDDTAPKLNNNTQSWLDYLGAATSSPTLDYQGNTAMAYRYHHKSEPALYVVDSDKFFEMVWYYPTALDTDQDKTAAISYAKRTYAIAKSALGGQALDFYDDLLKGKKPTLPKGIALAECGNYVCKVVFEKDKVF